jgi:carboxypeptidase Taq
LSDISPSLQTLKTRLTQLAHIEQAAGVLSWDQQTYMPAGAANGRAEQLATLSQLAHQMLTGDETTRLLQAAEIETQGQDADSDDVRLLARLRRSYDRATKLPESLVMELSRHSSLSQEVWVRARQMSDFDQFAPSLEKMLDLTRQATEYLGYPEHPYDALIDQYEPGTKQADVATMFADMKPGLIALTQAIAQSKSPVDDGILHGDFPIDKQRAFTLDIVKAIGYDMTRGRQDEAAHPFCSNFGRDDVRITTRFDRRYLSMSVYASMHEAGHAMYEQGSPIAYEATPLAGGTSLGVHESQSRLWENLVGRSRAFTHYLFPRVQQAFPERFANTDMEAYYRAINRVSPSLIRVEADEVTYNLHTLLRFELECALLEGQLDVGDLPDAWDAKMQEYLGITPPTDAEGCLQDVHWSAGLIGYFPTYSIGNLLSAQLWHAIGQALPDRDAQLTDGEFAPLLDWLRENVHQYGSKYLPKELVVKATGEPLTSRYYVDYLHAKYSDIYALEK